jgi:hypothetical protein
LPTTLHATGNLGMGSVAITWDGSTYWIRTGIVLSCGDTIDLRFSCGPGGSDCSSFVIEWRCNGGIWNAFFLTLGCTCSPLNVQGGNTLDPLANCTGCGNQQLNVTVTT